MGFLIYLLKTFLFGVIAFVILFILTLAIVVFIINKIVQKKEKAKLQNETPIEKTWKETPEFIEAIKEILRLLSNNDPQVLEAIQLLNLETKLTFAQTYLEEINMENHDDYDAWDLMIFTLEKFGYLSYNDWKFLMEDLVFNLKTNLEKMAIDPTIFDAYPELEEGIEPSKFPVFAKYLPPGYALAALDTGGDDYTVNVGPIENVRKVVEISENMELPFGVRSIEMFVGSEN